MKAKLIILSLFVICSFCASAQITLSYSIGAFGNSGAKATIFSSPFVINGNACFTVSNGISKYSTSKKGGFLLSCALSKAFIRYSLKVFPNPVVSVVTIQALEKLQVSNDFKIAVYTAAGNQVGTYQLKQDQLLAGFKVDMGNLPIGVYIIQLSSVWISETFKIIKAQ
jgi:Secretion system C-terminal sorting domain